MVVQNQFLPNQQEDSTRSTPENVAVADCPLSGDEAYEVNAPSPKKRREAKKKVISVPIGEKDGSSKSKAEVYPPPDSWSWRKYGQKPIKGSPYPRGYYRCSSSKGCPARKHVEKSSHDPSMLLITYTCEHNHSLPISTKHHHRHPSATITTAPDAPSVATSTSTSSSSKNTNVAPEFTQEEFGVPKPDSDTRSFSELAGELDWFSNVESTLLDSSALVGPAWSRDDMPVLLRIREEDESLFGDLGELPECSAVFRPLIVEETPCYAGSR